MKMISYHCLQIILKGGCGGPMADAAHDQMGTWCFDGDKTHSVTPLAAIKQQYGDKFEILYEKALISTQRLR